MCPWHPPVQKTKEQPNFSNGIFRTILYEKGVLFLNLNFLIKEITNILQTLREENNFSYLQVGAKDGRF
jgi:hypothetical protein